jgi:hypothetical protein
MVPISGSAYSYAYDRGIIDIRKHNHVCCELRVDAFLHAKLLSRQLVRDAARAAEFQLIVVILDASLDFAPAASPPLDCDARFLKSPLQAFQKIAALLDRCAGTNPFTVPSSENPLLGIPLVRDLVWPAIDMLDDIPVSPEQFAVEASGKRCEEGVPIRLGQIVALSETIAAARKQMLQAVAEIFAIDKDTGPPHLPAL